MARAVISAIKTHTYQSLHYTLQYFKMTGPLSVVCTGFKWDDQVSMSNMIILLFSRLLNMQMETGSVGSMILGGLSALFSVLNAVF